MTAGEKIAPRRPWLAGVLQIVMPGLGNLYSGRPLRGLAVNLSTKFAVLILFQVVMWTPRPLNLLILVLGPIFLIIFII